MNKQHWLDLAEVVLVADLMANEGIVDIDITDILLLIDEAI